MNEEEKKIGREKERERRNRSKYEGERKRGRAKEKRKKKTYSRKYINEINYIDLISQLINTMISVE